MVAVAVAVVVAVVVVVAVAGVVAVVVAERWMVITMGASEVAVALGLQRTKTDGEPYTSALELQARLTGALPRYGDDAEAGVDAIIGRDAEAMVLSRWCRRYPGLRFRPGPQLGSEPLVNPSWPWLHARPDLVASMAWGDGIPVELKAPRELDGERWGEDHTDQFPMEYLVQLAVQVAVMDAPFGVLFAMARAPRTNSRIDGEFRYVRDPDLERRILDRAGAWYHRHVVDRVPVEPDGSESAAWTLARTTGLDHVVAFATVEQEAEVRRLAQVRTAIREQERHRAELEQSIQQMMGAATTLRGVDGRTIATFRPDRTGRRRFRLVVRDTEG